MLFGALTSRTVDLPPAAICMLLDPRTAGGAAAGTTTVTVPADEVALRMNRGRLICDA
jgi:hypothetical protein